MLRPIPEANARTSALLSGQVDWIEAVAPDQAAKIKASGARVTTNEYPHGWNYMLSFQPELALPGRQGSQGAEPGDRPRGA